MTGVTSWYVQVRFCKLFWLLCRSGLADLQRNAMIDGEGAILQTCLKVNVLFSIMWSNPMTEQVLQAASVITFWGNKQETACALSSSLTQLSVFVIIKINKWIQQDINVTICLNQQHSMCIKYGCNMVICNELNENEKILMQKWISLIMNHVVMFFCFFLVQI